MWENHKDFRPKGHITVAELVTKLLELPQDAMVWHEGCDCLGAASTVEYDAEQHIVLIGRCN